MTRLLPLLLALAAFCAVTFSAPKEADATFLRLHLQGHGALLGGTGGDYFGDNDNMQLGWGGELGFRFLFFLLTADAQSFGTNDAGERIYWNQLLGGIELGLPLPFDRVAFDGRVQGGYVNGTFEAPVQGEDSLRSGGFAARAGAQLTVRVLPLTHVGGSFYWGLHTFGKDRGGAGTHVLANFFLRLQLGV